VEKKAYEETQEKEKKDETTLQVNFSHRLQYLEEKQF
jgi:hypothetical protein